MKKTQIMLNLVKNKELSLRRILNVSKNYFSYITKNTKVGGYPSIIMVEPTNLCNLRCALCPIGAGTFKAPKGSMKFEEYKKIIDEIGSYLLNLTLWNYGEPFLHKDIYQMIEYAKKKRIFTRISTNGHFFNSAENNRRLIKSGLDDLIICLDGASKETFLAYRKKSDFNKVMQGLKSLVEEKRKLKSKYPFIEIQFIIMKQNEHEIPKMKALAKELGVNKLTLKTVDLNMCQIDDKESLMKFLPSDERLSRYKKGEITRKVKVKNTCKRLWFSSVISWDGSVVPCCDDPNRTCELGNMFKEGSFKKVWNNEKYRNMRKAILKNKQDIKLCKNCPGTLMGLNVG